MTEKLKLYRLLLWKAYFDKGFSYLNYAKYFVLMFGLASRDVGKSMILLSVYCLACFILGWAIYRFEIIKTENEINNLFNPFQVEVRQKLKSKKI